MVRLRPSAARRQRAAIPRTREVQAPPRRTVRTRFNRVKSIVKRWRGSGTPAAPVNSIDGIKITGLISGDYVTRTVLPRYLKDDKIERWQHIHAGQLPPEDPTPPAPTADEVDDREQEALHQIQRWGEAKNEVVRSELESSIRIKNREIRQLEETQGKARPNALRRANRLSQRLQDEIADSEKQLKQIADQVREQRADERKRIRKEADQAETRVNERVQELLHGLKTEIEMEVNRGYFQTEMFELEDYEFI